MSLSPIEPEPTRLVDDWIGAVPAIRDLADLVAATLVVPRNLRGKPNEVIAIALYGRELGLSPMRSLAEIHVIEGTLSLSSLAMRALVFARGHLIVTEEWTDQRCVLAGYRRGVAEPLARVTYTLADAQRAGLHQRPPWRQHPRSMLYARATSELCKAVFPDVVGGLQLADDAVGEELPPVKIRRAKPPAAPVPEPRTVTEPSAVEPQIIDAEPVAEGEPEPPTPAQMRKLHMMIRERWPKADRDEILRELSARIGRPLDSRNQLTRDEVETLLDGGLG